MTIAKQIKGLEADRAQLYEQLEAVKNELAQPRTRKNPKWKLDWKYQCIHADINEVNRKIRYLQFKLEGKKHLKFLSPSAQDTIFQHVIKYGPDDSIDRMIQHLKDLLTLFDEITIPYDH